MGYALHVITVMLIHRHKFSTIKNRISNNGKPPIEFKIFKDVNHHSTNSMGFFPTLL